MRSPASCGAIAGAHVYELGDLDDFDWPLHPVVRPGNPVRPHRATSRCSTRSLRCRCCSRSPRSLLGGRWRRCCAAVLDALPAALYVHAPRPLARRRSSEALRDRRSGEPHLKLALAACRSRRRARARQSSLLAPDRSRRGRRLLRGGLPGYLVRARGMLDDGALRRASDSAGRLACVAGVHVYSPTWACGGARQRGDAAGASVAGALHGARALPSACSCSRTASRRSPSTCGPTMQRRSPRTNGSGSRPWRRTWRRASSRGLPSASERFGCRSGSYISMSMHS